MLKIIGKFFVDSPADDWGKRRWSLFQGVLLVLLAAFSGHCVSSRYAKKQELLNLAHDFSKSYSKMQNAAKGWVGLPEHVISKKDQKKLLLDSILSFSEVMASHRFQIQEFEVDHELMRRHMAIYQGMVMSGTLSPELSLFIEALGLSFDQMLSKLTKYPFKGAHEVFEPLPWKPEEIQFYGPQVYMGECMKAWREKVQKNP